MTEETRVRFPGGTGSWTGETRPLWKDKTIVGELPIGYGTLTFDSGEVYEFSNTEIESIQKKIAEELGFDLIDHRLELYGKKINK